MPFMRVLDDGGYAIDDRVDIPGEGSDHFVFTDGWLLEIITVDEGDFFFLSDGVEVRPSSNHFGVYYPPFTVTRPVVRSFKGRVTGVGSKTQLERLPSAPFIFETDFSDSFSATSDALAVLSTTRNRRSIEVNSRPSLLTVKAKRLIDENYLEFPSISCIASRLEVTPEHLSRQFKRDTGLSPSGYLRKLRVADATFRL